MPKKISVIGANGYIARNLIHVLEQKPDEYKLYLYDCQDSQTDSASNYQKIDILSSEDVKNINFQVDIIYMLVGKTGSAEGFQNPGLFIDVNEKALLNILNEYVRTASTAKLLFLSTRLVYKGKSGYLREDSEKEFKTIYAINKFSCEKYLEAYHNAFGIRYVILRVCLPYGTMISGASSYGTAEFMLNKAKKRENIVLYGKGDVRRTLTYIGDLCRIMINASLSEFVINDVYNVGGENYSLQEMAMLISGKYGVAIEYINWPGLAGKIESGDTVFCSEKLDKIISTDDQMRFADWLKLQ